MFNSPFFKCSLLLLLCSAVSSVYANDLNTALQATLDRHPSITGKKAEISAKNALSDAARAQRYPSVSTQAAAQQDSQPIVLRAKQPLWAFGRIDSNIRYADTDVDVQKADSVRVSRSLLDQTAVAYAKVLGVKKRIKVANENLAALEGFYQKIQRREEGNLASKADVRLALSRLMQARSQVTRYQGDLQVASAELQALTQIEIPVEQEVSKELTDLPSLAEIEKKALEKSADVLYKTRLTDLALADQHRENKASMPTLYLQADHVINQKNVDKETNVGLVFESNLDGLGMGSWHRSRAAGARIDAAHAELDAARNDIRRNVNSLYGNRTLQQGVMDVQQQTLAELTEILSSYQRQYEAGQKSWLEVLNMQRELTEQSLQMVQAENDWLIFSLKLVALTGGLDGLVKNKGEPTQ